MRRTQQTQSLFHVSTFDAKIKKPFFTLNELARLLIKPENHLSGKLCSSFPGFIGRMAGACCNLVVMLQKTDI